MLNYISTRGKASASGADAIVRGLAPDGGLFCPEVFPSISPETIAELCDKPYAKRVSAVLGMFLGQFNISELEAFAAHAYADFESMGTLGTPAPVSHLDDTVSLLELWHGPTSAFKDMALQMLPFLLTAGAKITGETRRICILTATSGDTGKAALEGFRDRDGTAVFVFYPSDGVSEVQRLQMVTQAGSNVGVCAIRGNFDNAQTGVKQIFSDKQLNQRLASEGWLLSSANSINPGRLLPQVAYYVSAYCDMVSSKRLKMGQLLDVTVPTGNFGNILAAYYAKQIGLPLGRLICASNRNDVLSVFLNTGVYDRRRQLHLTTSPSMDILVSSNFERALFHLSGQDSSLINDLMSRLTDDGVYTAPDTLKAGFAKNFAGGSCGDAEASRVICETWRQHGVLIDPHTAVGLSVARRSLSENPMLVVSTASPFKFGETVCSAIGVEYSGSDMLPSDALAAHTGLTPPAPLQGLHQREVRFAKTVAVEDMQKQVEDFVNKLRG